MKSAIELAMERSGGDGKKLTDAQKKKIADIREKAKADIAQEKIMFDQKAAATPPGPERDHLEQQHRAEVAKIEERAEAAVQKVRDGA